MFYFELAEVVQARPPSAVLFEIFSDAPRQENVSGVAAIHHALREVYSSAGQIGASINIANLVHGSAVNSHSNPKRGVLECSRDFHCTARRRLRAIEKNQHDSIAGR